MLRTNLLELADIAVVYCQGTIAGKQDTDALRRMVTSQLVKAVVVLDFSEVEAIEGEALDTLVSLWQIAHQHATRLDIFNPSLALYQNLGHLQSTCRFEFLTDSELLKLIRHADALDTAPANQCLPRQASRPAAWRRMSAYGPGPGLRLRSAAPHGPPAPGRRRRPGRR